MSSLQISVIPNVNLTPELRRALVELCSCAYEEDFTDYFELLTQGVHLVGWVDDQLVAHGAWVTRKLRTQHLTLNAAYIEAIATDPAHQGRGYATAIMKAMPALLANYDLAVLAPSNAAFYERLGWTLWQGPLSYTDVSGEEVTTPDEQVMILRLPRTPQSLDVQAPLSTDWRAIEVW